MIDNTTHEVVYELNAEVYDNIKHEYPYFEYRSTGFCEVIMFLGYPIWSSECDDRIWDEEKDAPEPLYDYVKKEAIKLIQSLQGALV